MEISADEIKKNKQKYRTKWFCENATVILYSLFFMIVIIDLLLC